MPLRQPIISILGHVDHGKTTLLDYIRGTRVAAGEPGLITQHVGASEVPAGILKTRAGELLKRFKTEVKVPGLLFIDTPGHEAFTFLRKRGGSLADIAVLVIDINEGIKPQTDEALQILKSYKTPFVIAANKIDKVEGWTAKKDASFSETFEAQRSKTQEVLDTRLYKLIGALYEKGFQAERYDRVADFTKQIAIIPISAITGEGVSDLLAILTGLTQRFLEENLKTEAKGPGKGTILEVKETKGLGITADAILYDGTLKKGDTLVIGGVTPEDIIETKVKTLLKTAPLKELRVEKQFVAVEEVGAASGVKISAPELENITAGVPFVAAHSAKEIKEARAFVRREIEALEIQTVPEGVIIKADALGSLEALARMLQAKGVPIRKAIIGAVSKKDIVELEGIDEKYKIILVFNAPVLPDAEDAAKRAGVTVLQSNIIYTLTEGYDSYLKELESRKEREVLQTIVRPAKFRFMPQHIFHVAKPAIVGVEILAGVLRPGVRIMRGDGEIIGELKALEEKGEAVKEAAVGAQVAASIEGATVDRNLKRGDTLYVYLTKDDYRKLKEHLDLLAPHEKVALEDIKEIMRKRDPMWEFV